MQNFIAFILLVICLPILVLVVLVLVVFQGMPIFFTQERLGINKNMFKVIKFRTMKDGKITFLGKVLRKTGIDELPQLVNIVKGDMHFVGPRPLTPFDVARLEWEGSWYNARWNVKPGISGLAQLSPVCHKKISIFLDKFYVKNKSVWLDLKIISVSFFSLIAGKRIVKKLYFFR